MFKAQNPCLAKCSLDFSVYSLLVVNIEPGKKWVAQIGYKPMTLESKVEALYPLISPHAH